ncbi:MAG: XRE family transcriptional regulator [Bacteroidaceae bacterium]|nr:XRE family transcriptional regulator [Bacteroidaceae bacterium]
MLHIGQQIKEELRRQERTVCWFARKLCCNRQNVYDIFKRTNIDAELLLRISLVLERNFFEEYTTQYQQALGGTSEKLP